MQLGMIGLGRMGANMVRRLMKKGHQCVVFDQSPKAVQDLVKENAVGSDSPANFLEQSAKPRAIWLMVPAGVVDQSIRGLLPHLGCWRHSYRRRQFLLHRRYPPRQGTLAKENPLRGCGNKRRRVGPRARLLHDDRRRDKMWSSISTPFLPRWLQVQVTYRGRPGARRHRRHSGARLSALRPEWRRPLR